MKAKLAILILAVACSWGQTAHADTVIDLSATLCSDICLPPKGFSTIDLQAQLTVEAVNGTWFDAGRATIFTGPVLEVKAITGTLNGNPISFFPFGAGDGSWLNFNLTLGTVSFSSNGFEFWLDNEGDYSNINYVQADGLGTSSGTVNVATTIVSTPEPSSLLLLVVGLLVAGMAFLRVWPFCFCK